LDLIDGGGESFRRFLFEEDSSEQIAGGEEKS
jgi:hypothetical protein